MTKPARGRFISFEGGEGTGKSTQAAMLAEALRARGFAVVETREPGGSALAEAIREVILSGQARPYGAFAEAVLFSAARADHLRATIRPALARGEWVVCDRFADSTRAYQGALGNLDPRLLRAMEDAVVEGTWPDLTLLLDMPAERGLARARRRSGAGDRFEDETLDYHRGLRHAFLDIAESAPGRIVVIDADRAAPEVAASIWKAVEARLLPQEAAAP
ncbi:MAG TPA: dTMP kinase [Hyphomicrobiales bacterium]|nr:dTMP kinase [Hyphomicrobiales bacterium]